jgi:hypothetical protein
MRCIVVVDGYVSEMKCDGRMALGPTERLSGLSSSSSSDQAKGKTHLKQASIWKQPPKPSAADCLRLIRSFIADMRPIDPCADWARPKCACFRHITLGTSSALLCNGRPKHKRRFSPPLLQQAASQARGTCRVSESQSIDAGRAIQGMTNEPKPSRSTSNGLIDTYLRTNFHPLRYSPLLSFPFPTAWAERDSASSGCRRWPPEQE